MRILLIGHGAREHCFARRLRLEGHTVLCIHRKANAGLQDTCEKTVQVDRYRPADILATAKALRPELVWVTTEEAVFAGVTDACAAEKLSTVGITGRWKELESDRRHALAALKRTHPELLGRSALIESRADWDRFAEGHGSAAVVCKSVNNGEGQRPVVFADAGLVPVNLLEAYPYVLEDYTPGLEFSIYCLTAGRKSAFPMAVRIYPHLSHEHGALTGGMGSTSMGQVPPGVSEIEFTRCVDAMKSILDAATENFGPLSCGGMLVGQFRKTAAGLRFTEIEIKPGDPESINFIESLASPLGTLLTALARKTPVEAAFAPKAVVCVDLAPHGYPYQNPAVTHRIKRDALAHADVYCGSVRAEKGSLYTDTSRALVIVGKGSSIEDAARRAKDIAKRIGAGLYYRSDIGLDAPGPKRKRHHYPAGTKASVRVAASTSALRKAGGARKTFRLSPQANLALSMLRERNGAPQSDTAIIERLLLDAVRSPVSEPRPAPLA